LKAITNLTTARGAGMRHKRRSVFLVMGCSRGEWTMGS
jgi:hypothetical protein